MVKHVCMTDKVRYVALAAFGAVVLGAVAGWLIGKDPNQLLGLLGAVVAAMGVGEASSVGKRATTKPELM